MPLYIGFDSSTQSLTAVVIEVTASVRRTVLQDTLSFDEALPSYGTRHGVLPSDDPRVATAPPMMWVEALERMMGRIARRGVNLSDIRAIAGSAQQHGSVYCHAGAAAALAHLDPAQPLVDQIRHVFSRDVSPIWMDTSTTADCEAITAAVGGPAALATLTGSRAFERFTGPQIRKFAREQPDAYARTSHVHLVSSFLASLLAGRHAPLEPGDASGMNLMDIAAGQWAPAALAATAEGLASKLPEIQSSWTIVGPLAPYWRQRFGFPACDVVAWSGDNPCSLIGVGLVHEGRLAISLGTSDTVFGFMREPRVDPSGAGHVFGSPTGGYMGLTCLRNGSLARERVRDEYGLDWRQFAEALRQTPPGNGGAIMLPWFEPEITPPIPHGGVRRFDLDATDAATNVRAVIEAQMMAMARHSQWMGVQTDTIVATGGAAVNREILQVMADVFGADVERIEIANSAALGAALRAYHAAEMARGGRTTWNDVVGAFTAPVEASRVAPRREYRTVYSQLMARHAACEAEALLPALRQRR
jgi:xylulokinase